jgi:undecaprenyl phosphate-alpha-L-ara4N flippase subunit ArnF
MAYVYIAFTLVFTVYGQIVIKWRFNNLEFELPRSSAQAVVAALFKMLLDPYILSGFVSAFIAALFWMAAMSKMDITKAYPFMSLAPIVVFIIGTALLNEPFTWGKVLGLGLISLGLICTVKF